MIPSKAGEVRAYATMLEDREPLTIEQLLLDLKCGDDLVYSIMSGDEDGDEGGGSGGDGVNDGDRDNASISNGGDIEDNTSC